MLEILVQCPFCGEQKIIKVPAEGYFAWQSGECIQNALPNLSADDREMLISGICPKCWEQTFGEDE